MAMTSPVRTSVKHTAPGDAALQEVKLSFVMASNYTLKNLPAPEDGDVKLRTVPAHYMAVVAFSGKPPDDTTVQKKRALVVNEIAGASAAIGVTVRSDSETLVYGYHDPFITPSFLRKNEVGVMVDLKYAR